MEGVGVVTTSPEGHQIMLRRLKKVRKVLRKSNAASPGADQALGEEEGVGWPLVLLGVSEGVAFVMLEDDAVGDAVGVTVVCVLLVSDIGFTGESGLTNDSLTCHPVVRREGVRRREGVGGREESNVSNTDNVSPLAWGNPKRGSAIWNDDLFVSQSSCSLSWTSARSHEKLQHVTCAQVREQAFAVFGQNIKLLSNTLSLPSTHLHMWKQ